MENSARVIGTTFMLLVSFLKLERSSLHCNCMKHLYMCVPKQKKKSILEFKKKIIFRSSAQVLTVSGAAIHLLSIGRQYST